MAIIRGAWDHLVTDEDGVFADYHLRVDEVTADDRPPASGSLRQHRFDATEKGAAKPCSIDYGMFDRQEAPQYFPPVARP